jgi:hypothetical protein
MKKTKELTIKKAESFSLVPTSMEQAIKMAQLIAESDLAPVNFKGKPGNVLIAVQMGAEIGISPMQAIQNIAIINGKPSIYGDMGKALLLSKGCRIEERDMREVQKLGEACCQVTRPDGAPPIVRTFSIDNAKDAGLWKKAGPWTTTPWRMLAWRAFWYAARDGASDMLRGLNGAEEVQDYSDLEPAQESQSTIAEPQRASEAQTVQEADPATDADLVAPGDTSGGTLAIGTDWKLMKSRKEGACDQCADEIMVGDQIFYKPATRSGAHAEHYAHD